MDVGIRRRFRRLRRLVVEVEGVLTDGSVYWGPGGEAFKRFHRPDWVGLTILRKQDVEVIVLAEEGRGLIEDHARRFGVTDVRELPADRLAFLQELQEKGTIDLDATAYMAADADALAVSTGVGLFIVPANASLVLAPQAHYVTTVPGGSGAVREVVEVTLGNLA